MLNTIPIKDPLKAPISISDFISSPSSFLRISRSVAMLMFPSANSALKPRFSEGNLYFENDFRRNAKRLRPWQKLPPFGTL